MRWNVFDPECPTRALLDRIGDKWTVLVVSALHDGPLHFGELKRAVGGIAPKVLTSVLRSLERDGILTRHVHTSSPLRVEYTLTTLGQSLHGAVEHLREWAEGNMTRINRARAQHTTTAKDEPAGRRESPRHRQPVPAHRHRRISP